MTRSGYLGLFMMVTGFVAECVGTPMLFFAQRDTYHDMTVGSILMIAVGALLLGAGAVSMFMGFMKVAKDMDKR